MFCVQEKETLTDPFAGIKETDPLDTTVHTISDSSDDDEPNPKKAKIYEQSSLNLKVYQIPAYKNTQPDYEALKNDATSILPKFVNNPLNLANPLAFVTNSFNRPYQQRYSLPTPKIQHVPSPNLNKTLDANGAIIRYKKNGEIAKKRGPPKGYKRKPKAPQPLLQVPENMNGYLNQAQNAILTSLLAATPNLNISNLKNFIDIFPANIPQHLPVPLPMPVPVPQVKVPEGYEHVELHLDPADWFPEEPYRMVFSRKKNQKWKAFPYRCEHCFKGYRVVSTLLSHAAERHGSVPKDLAIPCPCCQHVSTRRKHHKKHLETHMSRKGRIFCLYCIPLADPNEPYVKEPEKYPYDKFPQYWYANEESLRLHKKRKHPYAAMFNYNWFCSWGDGVANS